LIIRLFRYNTAWKEFVCGKRGSSERSQEVVKEEVGRKRRRKRKESEGKHKERNAKNKEGEKERVGEGRKN
jgi:hypothetical protein